MLESVCLLVTGELLHRQWPPLQPPFHFPSIKRPSGGWHDDYQKGVEFEEEEGGLDLNTIPFDKPPPLHDSPAFEDMSHMAGDREGIQKEEL